MDLQAHVGDMIWCDGNLVTPPTKYMPDSTTLIYYLTIACHNDNGETIYVDAKTVKKTARWVEKQSWKKGQDVILKGTVTSPETTSLDGKVENMKIRILNIATNTSRQGENL